MKRPLLALSCLLTAFCLSVGVTTPAIAGAAPACENRGAWHRQSHGGIEDDRYHLARGERVSCDSNGDDTGGQYNEPDEEGNQRHTANGSSPGSPASGGRDDNNGGTHRCHLFFRCDDRWYRND